MKSNHTPHHTVQFILDLKKSRYSCIIKINPYEKTQPILYKLDAIISVSHHVKQQKGNTLSYEATDVLKEHNIKGFTLNDELLKKRHRI